MRVIFTLFFCLWTGMLLSHPVSLSWIKLSIHEDHLEIRYRILTEDLVMYHHPEHDGFYNYQTSELISLLPKHQELLLKNFYIKDDTGKRIQISVEDINKQQLNSQQIAVMDLMKYSVTFILHVPIDPDWKKLSFYQEIAKHDAGIPAVSMISVYREGQTLIENHEISEGYPLDVYPTGNMQETNPSKLTSSYYSITASGTRHELTIPSSVLLEMMQIRSLPDANAINEIEEHFIRHNPVFGNNERLIPSVSNMISLDENHNSMIYLDLYYPSNVPLDSVRIDWEDFTWKFKWMESEIYTIDQVYRHTFSRYQPSFIWRSIIPVVNKETN